MICRIIAIFSCISLVGMLVPPITSAAGGSESRQRKECVVLLHGLGRTSSSMEPMAEALAMEGYLTANVDYPSRDDTIEKLSLRAIEDGLKMCEAGEAHSVHFVTHSMGGILLRYYLSIEKIEKMGRAVMLSPPNQGSEVADKLKDWGPFLWYNGPAGQQLGTAEDGFVLQLGSVDFPLGIITGDNPHIFDGWLTDAFSGPNDGKVAVERAKVKGMTDFLVVSDNHTYIMQSKKVIQQTIYFLQNGIFFRPSGIP